MCGWRGLVGHNCCCPDCAEHHHNIVVASPNVGRRDKRATHQLGLPWRASVAKFVACIARHGQVDQPGRHCCNGGSVARVSLSGNRSAATCSCRSANYQPVERFGKRIVSAHERSAARSCTWQPDCCVERAKLGTRNFGGAAGGKCCCVHRRKRRTRNCRPHCTTDVSFVYQQRHCWLRNWWSRKERHCDCGRNCARFWFW